MKQLSGLDAAFYHQDSKRTPMHVTAVLVYGPSAQSAPLDASTLQGLFEHAVAPFAFIDHKLVDHTMGMEEPYWVYDKSFSVNDHVHTQKLPAPGDWQQLKAIISSIHSCRLPMGKPLWNATLVEGINELENCPRGSVALVLRVHHAVADGMSIARLLAWMHEDHDAAPATSAALRKKQPVKPDFFKLWQQSSVKSWSRPIQLVKTLSNLLPRLGGVSEGSKVPGHTTEIANTKTRFNVEVEANRVFGAVQLPINEIKGIKRDVRRVTVNDIALCVVAGGLRSYLKHHGELPATSVVSGVPVNLRARGDVESGNNISMMQVGLATDISDPIQRLRAIHEYALIGKAKTKALGKESLKQVSDSLSPVILAEGIKLISFATMATDLPVPFHVLVSNVPGSVKPLALQGHPVHALFGLGPLRDSMGLFHIVSNTDKRYAISFTSCESMMPDADFYEACLHDSYASLLAACKNL
ncbi:MAG: wax ester/triacylglycerol synthase family O-acyltransferase [Gammaproteobacteria bacterium]|nr:wax ester/triacylglycerol synthase family O-acyltransferase [Gammaproteobacteria bacterium]NND38636.1 wax ester/triacylglycerol synthase family O-acyltransferase [Pseudomonadales bacterium]NNM11714.1 wax ester/triacylglycerol synthase family O-acyltransferase [Pseudomonadales bacterium]